MKAIEKMIEKLDEMIDEISKKKPEDNANIYIQQSLNSIFLGLKMKAYQYLSEELNEEIKNQKQ